MSTPKKSVSLLYTNDKEAEKKVRKISPFIIATNNKISWANNKQRSERPVQQEL